MKPSFTTRIRLLLGLLFMLIVIQFIAILASINVAENIYVLAKDIQSIMLAFSFLIFLYIAFLVNYLPYKLKQSEKRLEALIGEISKGNYEIDIDGYTKEEDTNFHALLSAISKMLKGIYRFDDAKTAKIYEHHQRILLLINLLSQECLILNIEGEIIYMNDSFRRQHPEISDDVIIGETIIRDKGEAAVFDTISEALRDGNNIYDFKANKNNNLTRLCLNGSIVRDRDGTPNGGVFLIEREEIGKPD